MENIMNKIVEKISAQDIIRANSQAEAKEAERIKLEAEQYKLQLKELKDSTEEYRKYLDEMRAEVKEYKSSLEEMRAEVKEYKTSLEGMREDTKVYSQKLEESQEKVHDVGVQVYRNVQAIVERGQNWNKEEFKDVAKKLESIQVGVETKNSALLPLSVITMLLVIADIVINVLRILGIL